MIKLKASESGQVGEASERGGLREEDRALKICRTHAYVSRAEHKR